MICTCVFSYGCDILAPSVAQVASQAEPIAKDITHGVIRPGATQVRQTAERLGDDEHRQRVQVATQKLAEQVRAASISFAPANTPRSLHLP